MTNLSGLPNCIDGLSFLIAWSPEYIHTDTLDALQVVLVATAANSERQLSSMSFAHLFLYQPQYQHPRESAFVGGFEF